MAVSIDDIKKLRAQTGAGIADCRSALEEAEGNIEKAKEVLKKKGLDKAASKSGREVNAGVVHSYVHAGKIGSLVEVLCETDFVAKTEDFKNLAQEVAMQVASMNPETTEELLEQDYIRDNTKKIKDLVTDAVSKLGENIQIGKISRIELGK